MKMYALRINMVVVLFLVAACTPGAAPTQEAPTVESQPTAGEKFHSLDTRTGIEAIDFVLTAVESGDPQSLRDLFSYTQTACMTVNALGGPPACRDGEAEGTSVEVLPMLGPEGSYLYQDEIGAWPGLNAQGIYAVFQVSESAYSDEYYPKGDYGVILVGKDENAVLQVNGSGIVRIDYILDLSPEALNAVLERSADELILAPIE
ncbi:MAG TPA: hypothetical protein VFQ23_25255 [Anaerolineales bacterium]|nr:hypothetical protein [Anaerolineales bacterium]